MAKPPSAKSRPCDWRTTENWYLDAWCHLRQNRRNFALDAISHAYLLDRPAKEVDDATLHATFTPNDGIFSRPSPQ